MPAAQRHCSELCHLVNEKGETEKREGVGERRCGVSFCCTPEGEETGRGTRWSEIAGCLIKTWRRLVWDAWSSSNKHQVSLGFQRKFHATKLYFMVLSYERLWNSSLWLLTLDIITFSHLQYRCKWAITVCTFQCVKKGQLQIHQSCK